VTYCATLYYFVYKYGLQPAHSFNNVRLLAPWAAGKRLSTALIPRLRFRAGQQQTIVYIERISGVDLSIAEFFEERASVPP
jgi:hypothetical protein